MAALALAGCASRAEIALVPPGEAPGHIETVFLGTTRALSPEGFTSERSRTLTYARYDISIPAEREAGSIPQPQTLPDPSRHFLVADAQAIDGEGGFRSALSAALNARPASERDIVIYVHGYNNTFAESLYRTAQMRYDFGLPGLALHFAWPSLESPAGYVYDRDSVLSARDDFERFLRTIVAVAPGDVLLVAHSMGSQLAMETLRSLSLSGDRSTLAGIDGVVLMSPDIDIDVFRTQASRIDPLPKPFFVFTSRADRALEVSARISGQPERLGNIETLDEVSQFDILFVDTTEFRGGDGDRLNHMAAATSPAMIQLLRNARDVDAAFDASAPRESQILRGTAETLQGATRIILAPINAVLDP
ncbi:MAG: alpha/beta fold hydrolase [Devosiaceae bacterium]|nr:alpha/beta fold hydrolase [Devosiaceae bacterium MH13]